jgi:hypothetical protein
MNALSISAYKGHLDVLKVYYEYINIFNSFYKIMIVH